MKLQGNFEPGGHFLKVRFQLLHKMTPTRAVVFEKVVDMLARGVEPTYDRLSDDLGIARPTVVRSIRWLEKESYVIKMNRFKMNLKPVQNEPVDQNEPVQNEPVNRFKMNLEKVQNEPLSESVPIVNLDLLRSSQIREVEVQNEPVQNEPNVLAAISAYEPPTADERILKAKKLQDEANQLGGDMKPMRAMRLLERFWLELYPGHAQATTRTTQNRAELEKINNLGTKVCSFMIVELQNFDIHQENDDMPGWKQGVAKFLLESDWIGRAKEVIKYQKAESGQNDGNKPIRLPLGGFSGFAK